MNAKEFLKKFWFVVLVGVVLTGFVIYYAKNAEQPEKEETINVTEKVNDEGNSVIFSIDGFEYTAADLVTALGPQYEAIIKLYAFEKVVADEIKTSDEISTYVANYVSYLKQQYDEDELLNEAKLLGFTGKTAIVDLITTQLKVNDLAAEYLDAHLDKYPKPYYEENEPKIVSHILVKVADVTETTDAEGNTIHIANPTDEEQAKLDEVLKALETEDFGTVALNYSEDTGSASSNGSLGLVTKSSVENYVSEFKDTVNSMNKTGEVSAVITTTYGYHIIKIDAAGYDDLKDNDEFKSAILSNDTTIKYIALFAKAEELEIAFANEEDLALVKAYCGLEAE